MIKRFLIPIFLCFLYSTCIEAIEVKTLYSAKIAVASQTEKDQNQAIQQALNTVLIKVGGKKIAHPMMKSALKNYHDYLSKYLYINENGQLLIHVFFNEEKINALFKQTGSQLWGKLRPQIIVWFVKEDNLDRSVLSASSDLALTSTITEFSHSRGLPLLLPIMDLEDLNSVTIADLWGRFFQPITQASTRYLAESIVVIRLSNSSLVMAPNSEIDCAFLCEQSQIALDWSLLSDVNNEYSQTFSNTYQGNDENILINNALNDITEIIYQQYALAANIKHDFKIDIANIDSLEKIVAVTNFLTQLSAVESVQLIKAEGKLKRFKISLIGSAQSLMASFALSEQLNRYVDPLNTLDELEQIPVYYWQDTN